MQLTVNEFELLSNLLLERKQEEIDELAHKFHRLQKEHDTFKSVFKDLERSYTERGKALEAATKLPILNETASRVIANAIAGYEDDRYRFSKLGGLADNAPEIVRIDSQLTALRSVLGPSIPRADHVHSTAMFKILEQNYTERGKALEAATKGAQLGQWLSVSDLHFQIGYSGGAIMGPLKFTGASAADRVRFFYGESGALDTSAGALDTSAEVYYSKLWADPDNVSSSPASDTSTGQPGASK